MGAVKAMGKGRVVIPSGSARVFSALMVNQPVLSDGLPMPLFSAGVYTVPA